MKKLLQAINLVRGGLLAFLIATALYLLALKIIGIWAWMLR